MPKADTCSTCRFWVPNDEPQGIASDHGWGECRCHPPHVIPAPRGYGTMGTTVWPITTGELGCGEHKERVLPSKAQIRDALVPPTP